MLTEIIYLLVAFVITAILGRLIIPVLKKLKVAQTERTDGPRTHLRKQGTPTMGGVMMMITIILLVIACLITNNELKDQILPVALASLGFGLVGFIDDFKKVVLKNTDGLSPKLKLFGQLLISVAFLVYLMNYTELGTEIKIPFTQNMINLPTWIYVALMVLVMLGTTNAINLTDGVDGLAGSVTAIIVGSLAVIAYKAEMFGISLFGAIVCGACARIFNI